MAAEGLYVSTAGAYLHDRQQLQDHYQSDFHRYNLKRKIAGLPPVTKEWYEARKAQLLATAATPVQKVWFDPLSKKKFYSEGAYQTFVRSKKYQELVKKAGGEAPAPIVTLRKVESGSQQEAASAPAAKPAAAAAAASGGFTVKPAVKAAAAAAAAPEAAAAQAQQAQQAQRVREVEQASDRAEGSQEDGEGSDWETASEEEMQAEEKWEEWDVRRCLFDNTQHPSMEANLEYMFKNFGFYFPDAEFLTDPEGLLKYLGAKLQYGHVPLYESGDNPNAKQFASLHAVQRHMVDTNQCKMQPSYEEDEEEYADFYDYSAMDVDGGEGAGALIVSPEEAGAAAGYELVLAGAEGSNGGGGARILGSREFHRYYRQRPRLGDARESVQRASVLAQYRRLAIPLLADSPHEADMKKQNEKRARRFERARLAMSMRKNINDNLPKNVPY